MTLTELRYIVAVARERHFGRAAEACFVSQPTLSVGVRKLEEELGVTLFERGAGEVRPTAVGERVVEQAQRALEEVAALKQIAETGGDPLAGPLRLGAIFTIGPYLLPRLIPRLRAAAPLMPLLIEEDLTANLSERLKSGDLDVIVIALPFDEPGIRTRALYDEPFVVLLPVDHPWTEKDAIEPDALSAESLLLLGPGHCFRDQVLKACPDCQRSSATPGSMQKTLEGGSLETIRHMVAGGAGITVLPCTSTESVGRFDQGLVTTRPFAPPVPQRRVALAWRKSFPRPEAVTAVARAIAACELPCVVPVD